MSDSGELILVHQLQQTIQQICKYRKMSKLGFLNSKSGIESKIKNKKWVQDLKNKI